MKDNPYFTFWRSWSNFPQPDNWEQCTRGVEREQGTKVPQDSSLCPNDWSNFLKLDPKARSPAGWGALLIPSGKVGLYLLISCDVFTLAQKGHSRDAFRAHLGGSQSHRSRECQMSTQCVLLSALQAGGAATKSPSENTLRSWSRAFS